MTELLRHRELDAAHPRSCRAGHRRSDPRSAARRRAPTASPRAPCPARWPAAPRARGAAGRVRTAARCGARSAGWSSPPPRSCSGSSGRREGRRSALGGGHALSPPARRLPGLWRWLPWRGCRWSGGARGAGGAGRRAGALPRWPGHLRWGRRAGRWWGRSPPRSRGRSSCGRWPDRWAAQWPGRGPHRSDWWRSRRPPRSAGRGVAGLSPSRADEPPLGSVMLREARRASRDGRAFR